MERASDIHLREQIFNSFVMIMVNLSIKKRARIITNTMVAGEVENWNKLNQNKNRNNSKIYFLWRRRDRVIHGAGFELLRSLVEILRPS